MLKRSIKKQRHPFFLTLMVLSLILTILPLPMEKALACDCPIGDAKEKLSRSSVVFLGRVVDIGGRINGEVGGLRKYIFEVETMWKGELNKRITIYSNDGDGPSCGYRFKRNGSYLVFSYLGDNEMLQTSLCSGNITEKEAESEILALGPGTKVNERIFANNSNSETSKLIYVYFGLGMIILAGSILAIIIRKRRGKK